MNKHILYARYVLRHKWFVLLAGLRLYALAHERPVGRLRWWWQLAVHDLSKFRSDEWRAYADYFYGEPVEACPPCKRARQVAFDRAWLLHIHRNPHHWQHWLLREDSGASKTLRMPARYALEMVADWMGAGRAMGKGDDMPAWYRANRLNMALHPNTRYEVEELVNAVRVDIAHRDAWNLRAARRRDVAGSSADD